MRSLDTAAAREVEAAAARRILPKGLSERLLEIVFVTPDRALRVCLNRSGATQSVVVALWERKRALGWQSRGGYSLRASEAKEGFYPDLILGAGT